MGLYFSLAASALALAWVSVHVVMGGREIGNPLRGRGEVTDHVKAIAWLCWHYTTILLIALFSLLLAGAVLSNTALTIAGTLIAFALWLFGVFAARITGQGFSRMPQGWLFLPIALLPSMGAYRNWSQSLG